MERESARRPLKTRSANWPRRIAFALVEKGFTPNQISITSVVFSSLGAYCLFAAGQATFMAEVLLFLAGAACIQLRLLCNLLDGLMAVEGGKKTKTGEIF